MMERISHDSLSYIFGSSCFLSVPLLFYHGDTLHFCGKRHRPITSTKMTVIPVNSRFIGHLFFCSILFA